VNVDISLSTLSVVIQDLEGQVFNWMITTSPNIGSNSGSGSYNGTKSCTVSGVTYGTVYTWTVKAYDGNRWTNKTYTFTTQSAPGSWWNANWIFRKEITIDHTKVDAINLPSDINLATRAQADGDDIVFTDAQGHKLNHEIELFTKATGQLIAWVNVTSLSSTIDPTLYLYYGNSVCANQQNQFRTWNAEYLMVHHMNETGNVYDSTSHGYTGTNSGTTTELNGKIGSCRYFDAFNDIYNFGNSASLNPGLNSWTISLWTRITHVEPYLQMMSKWGSNAGFTLFLFNNGANRYNYLKVGDSVNTKKPYRYWDTLWSDGNWHYITAVINRVTNQIDVYLDGTLHNGFANSDLSGMGSLESTANFYLYGGTNGRHDEFTISTTVRTAGWIKTSYINQNDPANFYSLGPQEQTGNQPPLVFGETPADNSMNVDISQSSLNVVIQDPEGQVFNWMITTSPNIGSNSGSGSYNGTKSCTVSGLIYGTTYAWTTKAYDGQKWTNTTFHFTTKSIIPTLKWSQTSTTGNSKVGPLAADVNNDGQMEVVRSGQNGIVVYSGTTGNVIWTKSMPMWDNHIPIEAIDLNKDGILEIICSNGTGTMAIYGNNHTVYWNNPNAPLYNKHPVTGDINADGYPEVFVCTAGAQDASILGSVTGLTHDGQIFAQVPTYFPCFGGLSLGDTNSDGIFELYLNERNYGYGGTTAGKGLRAFWATNLTERWNHPEMISSSHCPTLIDTNKDGILDVVDLHQRGGIAIFNSADGSIIHQIMRIPGLQTHSQPTIYDIDNDGNLELIACGGSDTWSKPIIWDLYTWSLETWLPFDCLEPPAIADIDGDGNVEILASTETNISIFNHNYQFIGSIPLANDNDYYGMAVIVAQDIDNDGLLELVLNRFNQIYAYDTIGAAPTPRALSQFNYYSPQRGRSPYYIPYGPLVPLSLNEYPANGSSNIPYNPQLSTYVFDYQNDLMTITIRTNATTGGWHTLRTYSNVHEGTYTVDTTGINIPHKMYWWSVTITDSTGQTTTKIYKFKTVGTIIVSNPTPTDLAKDIGVNPQLSIYAVQRNGLPMTIRFLTNATGSWTIIGTNVSVYNGTYSQKPTTMSSYNKKYYWSVQCYDQQLWTNETLSFTTFTPSTGQWWNLNWTNRKFILVDHTKINTNLVNFPVLINLPSDADLAARAQTDGNDIVFTDYQGHKLNHEIELFTKATGQLIAWVNVTSLSSTTDTKLYLYYGNSAASNQQNQYGTWNAEYLMVQHMEENGNVYDSTSHSFSGTNYGTTNEINGKIGACRYFDSINDYYSFGNSALLNPGLNSMTISLWTKLTYVNAYPILSKWGSNTGFIMYLFDNGVNKHHYFKVGDSVNTKKPYRYWDTSWSDGNWHYITAVINRVTNQIDVYLDGTLHNGFTNSNLSGMGSLESTANLYLYGGTNGRQDEFTLSTTIRNANWIKTSYNNQNNPSSFSTIYPEEPIPPASVNMSNPQPSNQGIDIQLSPKLRITVTHSVGYLMNINWKTNASGTWTTIGSNASVPTGTYTCSNTGWASSTYKRYWWRVEVHDYHGHWTNATFSFRTIAGPPTQDTPLLVLSSRKLICYNQSTVDPNGFRVYNTYQWIKNSQSITRLLLPFNTRNLMTVKDYSGYNNNGAIKGATWISNGVVGGAYSFSGIDSNDYISIPHSTSLDGNGAWDAITIEQWINLSDNQFGSRIMSKMSSQSEAKRSYDIGIADSMPANKLYGGVVIGNNSYKEAVCSTSLVAGQWYHVVLTYKSGVGVKLYLNGVLVATNTSQTTGNIQASPGKMLCIGAYNGSSSFLYGSVDEVKIYPFALTAQQINQEYLQERYGISSSSTMVDEETATGEQWKCAITPSNSYFDGVTKTSNAITIVN
jgi:hypothetical protein